MVHAFKTAILQFKKYTWRTLLRLHYILWNAIVQEIHMTHAFKTAIHSLKYYSFKKYTWCTLLRLQYISWNTIVLEIYTEHALKYYNTSTGILWFKKSCSIPHAGLWAVVSCDVSLERRERSNPTKQMKPYLAMTQEDLNSLSRLILSFVAYFSVAVDSTLWRHSVDNQEGSSIAATSLLFIKEVYIFSKMENLLDPGA